MKQNTQQPKGSTETSALTEFSEIEQQLVELLQIEQAIQSIAIRLKPMIEGLTKRIERKP